MKRAKNLLRVIAIFPLLLPLWLGQIVHADVPPLIISEVKVRNNTNDPDGFDEFIEIYNPTADSVSLNEYKISYINTPTPLAGAIFNAAVIGDGLLEAGNSFILAKNETDPNIPLSKKSPFSSLLDGGGTLRILDNENNIIDQFAWTDQGLAILPVQYLPNTTATKSQSFNRSKDVDDKYVLANPEWDLVTPTPVSSVLLPLPVPDPDPDQEPEPSPDPVVQSDDQPAPDSSADAPDVSETTLQLSPLQITELLPNPAAPASDSTDEFIELYNPNDQSVDLTGYKLQSGNTFNYSHTFAGTSLGAQQYKIFLVTETGNILSNTSGQARLLDPSGAVVAQTNAYDSADDGDAWALINGAWQWTTTPTPNALNVLTVPVLKVAAAKTAVSKNKTAAAKKPKAKTTAKVAAAKTKKPAAAAAERQVYEDPAETIAPIHPGILAGVGVITLVYAAYEYRYDVINRMQQFRRYREIRRTARAASKG